MKLDFKSPAACVCLFFENHSEGVGMADELDRSMKKKGTFLKL